MSGTRVSITLGGCFFALALLVWAQARKPGLWELTATQTWQQSPMPPGMTAPGGAASPFAGGPHTSQVCLTQQMIDKYDAIIPQQSHACQITNLVKKANGMTADMICTGTMTGKATLESTAIDPEHAKGKMHFTGSMKMGPNTRPVEYTVESSSVFKSADCGSVKPAPMPDSK